MTSTTIQFVAWGIIEMGEMESLDKKYLVGRGGGMGEIIDSGVRVYEYGDDE